MRSAVRIRPAAPERKPPYRVVFCFGKLRCGVEVYPRRGKSAQQLQNFRLNGKVLADFVMFLQLFACFCNLEKRPRYQKTAFYQLTDQLFDRRKARNPLQRNSRPAGKSCGGRRFMLYIKVCLRIQPEESEGLAS